MRSLATSSCAVFPTLSEQESGQTRQMDRGEIEVEEERRVRTECMPVFPTDSEIHESKRTHVASRSQCKTEDSRKHLEIESSLPRVAMHRGFLARGADADEHNVDTEASQHGRSPSGVPRSPRASCGQLFDGKP